MPQYASAQALQERYPERDLVQLTDPAGQVLNAVRLDRALAGASAVVDGYLQGRYPLPLAAVPEMVIELTCDIAMYRLQTLRPADDIEDARARYKDAIRFLEQVARGELQLGLADGTTAAEPAGTVELIEGRRVFGRGTMEGY